MTWSLSDSFIEIYFICSYYIDCFYIYFNKWIAKKNGWCETVWVIKRSPFNSWLVFFVKTCILTLTAELLLRKVNLKIQNCVLQDSFRQNTAVAHKPNLTRPPSLGLGCWWPTHPPFGSCMSLRVFPSRMKENSKWWVLHKIVKGHVNPRIHKEAPFLLPKDFD